MTVNIREKLTKACPYPNAWDKKSANGHSIAELAYFRYDYDGYRWWTTTWPINKEHETTELIAEFDSVLVVFCKSFPTLSDLKDYCHKVLAPTPNPIEYNAFLDLGGPGFYWLRIRLIERDYNLYLHCLSKDALLN